MHRLFGRIVVLAHTSRGVTATAVLALLAALTASAALAYPAHTRLAHKRYTFYLIAGITTDPFYLTMERGAIAEARKLGVGLVFAGAPDQFTPASQSPYVDLAIARHASAILISPTDRHALNVPLRQAVNAGIPVITLDTSITARLAVTHISSRNRQGGALAAQTLAHAIHGRGSVLGISVRPGVSTTDARERGFIRGLQQFPHIRYLGTRYDDDNVQTAAALTQSALTNRPGITGIFAMNSLSGDGVIAGLMRTHKQRQVRVVEFDTEPTQVYTLRRGVIDALIAQDPWTMGNEGIKLAYRWVTRRRTGIKTSYFTREVVITRANVDNPRLQRFLYTSP
jgi:ribose transport system substrate-binding protein